MNRLHSILLLLFTLAFALPRLSTAAPGDISTFAGGEAGDGGAATGACVHSPGGVAIDSAGNIFIADHMNNRVRKVAAGTGIITTVAGTGVWGYSGDNGPATAAMLKEPVGVAVDNAGNVYIAELFGQRVRKVDAATGIITTVAGTGTSGFNLGEGGPATSADLNYPTDVVVDGAGNLYIAVRDSYRVRKVAAGTGIITTVAGNGNPVYSGDNGPAAMAGLVSPTSVALDSAGNLYIADRLGARIRMVSAATGIITTVAGTGASGYSGDGGPATSALLNAPAGVAVDGAGNLYIADGSNNMIRKVAAGTGIITTVAGTGAAGYSGDNGAATSAVLNSPSGVIANGSGSLYVADTNNNRVRKVAGGTITTLAGNGTPDYSGDGGPAIMAALYGPTGVATDGTGNIYIADSANNRVRKVTVATGGITTVAGTGAAGYSGDNGAATAAMLNKPTGVAVDGSGNVFIADHDNQRVRKVTAGTGTITTVAGKGVPIYWGDNGPAVNAYLYDPYSVAVDGAGNLYIADTGNDRVRKVAAGTGIITTVAGTGSSGYTGDNGPATAATLDTPDGIAVDSGGNLYIADQYNNCIRKVTAATGTITTVAGGTRGYAGDSGPATAASMINPYGVTVDGAGNLYIADWRNDRIRKIAGNPNNLLYSFSLTVAGTGGGSVNSSPTGLACTGGSCTASFAGGEVVTLIPTPDANSLFGGWSGACTAASGNCSRTMDANQSATATFTYVQPVRVVDSPAPVYFSQLQAAYKSAPPYSTIQARAFTFTENLLLGVNMPITIEGGYDTSYAANSGITWLQGTLTVGQGQLVVERLGIR